MLKNDALYDAITAATRESEVLINGETYPEPPAFLAALRERGFDVLPLQGFRRVDGSVQPEAEALFWSLRENVREHLDPETFATIASDANLDRVLAALQGRGFRIVPVEKAS